MVQRRAIRWTINDYSPYSSVTQTQQELSWWSLDQRRADVRLCMLYKITHGMVAIQMPSYFKQPQTATRHSLRVPNIPEPEPYSFPLAVVQWNKLPSSIVMLPTLTQFSVAVRFLDHQLQQICFLA